MQKWKHLKLALCGVLAASLLNGCDSPTGERPRLPKMGDITGAIAELFGADPRSDSDPTAEALYQDGIDYFERGRYSRSISFFQKLRDEYPFSKEAEAAELKIAEAYYKNEEYVRATETYRNYLTFQPTGRHTHFVKYQLGRVNLDQFTGIDRDLEKVKAAKRYFESVIADHPESGHVPDARKRLAETRVHLADRELYVGNFYLKEKNYWPARERFENILRDYPDTPAAPKAVYALGDTHRLENNDAKAALAYRTLIERYPEDSLADGARTELARLPATQQVSPESLLTPKPSTDGAAKTAPDTADPAPKPQFVIKKGFVQEDPGQEKRWYGYLNPFSWGREEAEPEETPASSRQAAAGEGKASTEEPEPAEEKKSFFSFLNPFSSSGDKPEEPKKPSPAEATSAKAVVEDIDKTLGTRGPSGGDAPKPPESDLPEEKVSGPPPSDPAKVLGDIDTKLGGEIRQGDAPRPPASDPELFSVRKPKEPAGKAAAGEAQPGLLEGIDKQLRREGIGKPRELPTPPASP